MKKYYIGLAIIILTVLGISGYGIAQATSARADKVTERRSQEIAEELNKYIEKENKAPDSLDAAGIKDVPNTIRYTKKSDTSYEFCATYKKASDNFYFGGIESVLWGSAFSPLGGYGGYDDSDYYSNYPQSTLYLPYSHKQGENCQTVEPYQFSDTLYDYYDDPYLKTNSSSKSTYEDIERQTDIKSIHAQLEAYYAQNGYYPTFENLNNSSWISANMKGLDTETLKDPSGASYFVSESPAKNVYSYTVAASGGGNCDNTINECATYSLAATLENGEVYTKNNLN